MKLRLPNELQKDILSYIPAHNITPEDLAYGRSQLTGKHFWHLLHWGQRIRHMEWWASLRT